MNRFKERDIIFISYILIFFGVLLEQFLFIFLKMGIIGVWKNGLIYFILLFFFYLQLFFSKERVEHQDG
jgi:Ca2+/Na+ antiporter